MKITSSSRRDPCPVCGRTRDGDCRIREDGFVLCHTERNGVKKGEHHPQKPFIYCGYSDKAQGSGMWLPEHLSDPSKKGPRELHIEPIYFDYKFWDGTPTPAQRYRKDTPSGKEVKWCKGGLQGAGEVNVAPYQWHETETQRQDGELLFVVKGELKAQKLAAKGFATISILVNSERLVTELRRIESQVVLAPDNDLKDLDGWYTELSNQLPAAKHLIPALKGMDWRNPKSIGGLGVEDWLERSKPDYETIASTIQDQPWTKTFDENIDLDDIQPATVAEIGKSVVRIEQAAKLSIEAKALIGGELGAAIDNRAELLEVPASVLLNGILPVAASQLPCSTWVMLNEDMQFKQKPILWSLSVAPTGSNKSETSDLAVKPLYEFQDAVPEAEERHFFTSSFTMPGLSRVQASQPDKGCIVFPDELSGFIRKLSGDAKNGKDDGLSRLLTLYDGKLQRGNFSDKSLNYNIKASTFSLLSTIQPSVLLECMGDLGDESGLWARFNLCEIPMKRRRMKRGESTSDGLMKHLNFSYQLLQRWPAKTYGLSDEAADLFDDYYDQCETQRLDQTLEPALRAYAAKQQGRCGRVALVLHCLKAATSQVQAVHLINAETMLGAIQVCDFYEHQLKRFYSLALANVTESLEGNVLLVFNFIKNAGGVPCTVRQINKGPRSLRKMTAEEIKQAVAVLLSQKLIKEEGGGYVAFSL